MSISERLNRIAFILCELQCPFFQKEEDISNQLYKLMLNGENRTRFLLWAFEKYDVNFVQYLSINSEQEEYPTLSAMVSFLGLKSSNSTSLLRGFTSAITSISNTQLVEQLEFMEDLLEICLISFKQNKFQEEHQMTGLNPSEYNRDIQLLDYISRNRKSLFPLHCELFSKENSLSAPSITDPDRDELERSLIHWNERLMELKSTISQIKLKNEANEEPSPSSTESISMEIHEQLVQFKALVGQFNKVFLTDIKPWLTMQANFSSFDDNDDAQEEQNQLNETLLSLYSSLKKFLELLDSIHKWQKYYSKCLSFRNDLSSKLDKLVCEMSTFKLRDAITILEKSLERRNKENS